jgi:hypothetical protein
MRCKAGGVEMRAEISVFFVVGGSGVLGYAESNKITERGRGDDILG